ncbi:hypothetical protein AVEN_12886-1 [Araneus ventricosus]|uniref:Uncharacterized protein n=1 Tax=Araneus ventricosus TaxID=182803 RepID=A0A4Y2HKU4_ARAVE|nr:hypothetical protein AVEN_12886-1 [Araneus ventricosus]
MKGMNRCLKLILLKPRNTVIVFRSNVACGFEINRESYSYRPATEKKFQVTATSTKEVQWRCSGLFGLLEPISKKSMQIRVFPAKTRCNILSKLLKRLRKQNDWYRAFQQQHRIIPKLYSNCSNDLEEMTYWYKYMYETSYPW